MIDIAMALFQPIIYSYSNLIRLNGLLHCADVMSFVLLIDTSYTWILTATLRETTR